MLKQNLSQKMLQKLSPQQIQLMKLLQIPTATLEQRIKEELEANPALEEGEEVDDFAESNNTEDDLRDDDRSEELGEEGFELDEYWEEYAEDDPAPIATKPISAAQMKKTRKPLLPFPILITNTWKINLGCSTSPANEKNSLPIRLSVVLMKTDTCDGIPRRSWTTCYSR
jgi:hypothetical protein